MEFSIPINMGILKIKIGIELVYEKPSELRLLKHHFLGIWQVVLVDGIDLGSTVTKQIIAYVDGDLMRIWKDIYI